MSESKASVSAMTWVATLGAVAGTMVVLDLTFLGVIAKGFYDSALGPLRAPSIQTGPALLFYAMYVGFVVAWAVRGALNVRDAAWRGAGLGCVAYATYELTNWAVLRDWPAVLVPVDIAWGVALTTLVSAVGRWVFERRRASTGP